MNRDLNEFKVGEFMKKYQPLKGVTRALNVKDMVSKDKSIGDRISSGIGVVKPYDIGGMLMKPIFDQGKKGKSIRLTLDTEVQNLTDAVKEKADAMIYCNSIHYVPDKNKLLTEIRNKLNSNGILQIKN